MNIKAQISALFQLASIDGNISIEEKEYVYMLGKAHNLEKNEIDALINDPVPIPPMGSMTEEDKFEFLYSIIQLMKVDKKIFLSERKLCEALAEKLGYNKKIIGKLSKYIYGDPGIKTDTTTLQTIAKKYRLKK